MEMQKAMRAMSAAPPWKLMLPVTAVALLLLGAVAGQIPLKVLLAYAVAGPASFLAYGLDKQAAVHGRWRIRESCLLLIDLAGGWPAGALAQVLFRHKTRKFIFQFRFWAVALLNSTALMLMLGGYWKP